MKTLITILLLSGSIAHGEDFNPGPRRDYCVAVQGMSKVTADVEAQIAAEKASGYADEGRHEYFQQLAERYFREMKSAEQQEGADTSISCPNVTNADELRINKFLVGGK